MISVMVLRTLGMVVLRRLVGVVGLGHGPDAKDVEIAVLQHQLAVLRRQGQASPVHPERPARAGLAGAATAAAKVVSVLGDAGDTVALASGTGGPPLDLPA